MNIKPLTTEQANEVYYILVICAKAPLTLLEDFIQSMTKSNPVEEFRFGGALDFGGKYWIERNEVTFYKEHIDEYTCLIEKSTNLALHLLKNKWEKDLVISELVEVSKMARTSCEELQNYHKSLDKCRVVEDVNNLLNKQHLNIISE